MSADWQNLTGKGGAFLIERASDVQKAGGVLSPVALRLVEEEVQRLTYILKDEFARLEPSGELTAGAIASLKATYQARLVAAHRVLAVSRGVTAAPPVAQQAVAPAPAATTVPAPTAPAPPVIPPVPAVPTRSLREFFADRSILIISYIGAFLLIVATLLFELSAFTAVNGTARFVGVLILNAVFALAGWACFRVEAMRLVGRTYVAIAALMLPLTFIAAWVFLVLGQYGLSRDLAVALAGTACALLYGALSLRLQSQGYAVLSLVALGVAWIAGINAVRLDPWQGALLTPLAAIYVLAAHRWSRFPSFHQQFSRYAEWAMHGAASLALGWTLLNTNGQDWSQSWRMVAVTASALALVYFGETLLQRDAAGGIITLAMAGLAWLGLLNAIGLEPWIGLLLTSLVGLYILTAYRSQRVPAFGSLFSAAAEPFIHGAALLALGWTLYSASTVGDPLGTQSWHLYAATLAVLALLYGVYARLSRQRFGGLASMAALGLAWFCVLNGVDIWPWRGLAFAPVMALYVLVASRPSDLNKLFASEPEVLINTAGVAAVVWSLYATLTAPDISAGTAWYPAAATLAIVALLYALDTWWRGDEISPVAAQLALLGAWIAAVNALQLGDWRGLALTPLVAIYSLVAFTGPLLASAGARFAERAEFFIHGAAVLAVGWSTVPAFEDFAQNRPVSEHSFGFLAATFGALTIAYAIYATLSGRRWMQWTVAVGVTLTTITLNQALGFSSSALAVEFVLLAVGKAVAARFYRGTRMHTFLYVSAAVQALIAARVPVEQDWLRAAILVVAGLMATFMAVDGERPEWLYLAGAFFTYGWYWLLKVAVPPQPNPGPDLLVLMYSPLPVIYAAIAIWLRRVARPSWRWPVYGWAGAVALGVAALGHQEHDYLVLGIALIVFAAVGYVTAALERIEWAVPVATLAIADGVWCLLNAANASVGWHLLGFVAAAWVAYLGGLAWRGQGEAWQEWTRFHRYTGLGLLAIAITLSFTVPDLSTAGSLDAIAALAATLLLGAMLGLDSVEYGVPASKYVGLVVASVGSYWLAHYFNAVNPQWYVVAPGVALVASGLLMQTDRQMPASYLNGYNTAIGVGATMMMGVTSIQTFDPDLSAAVYTTLLLGEAVTALLVGIAMRSRVLVLAGATGVALASLRALILLIQQAPLFIAFGLVAILLLAGAAALAVLRQRFAEARVAVTHSWNDWR